MKNNILLFILLFAGFTQCRSDENDALVAGAGGAPRPVDCDTCKYAVVFVHGFLASGDTWTRLHQLFTSNGYKAGQLYAFDWNSLSMGSGTVTDLDRFIDGVISKTGRNRVRLVGHSAGGGVCYNYLSDSTRAAKVDGYVHVASSQQAAPPGNGRASMLNLWSAGDKVSTGRDIAGALNMELKDKDHYQVATSDETFAAIYRFFHGQEPATLQIRKEDPVCITGRVLSFGENKPVAGALVNIYALDSLSGKRTDVQPFYSERADSAGYWKAVNVAQGVRYEFEVVPPGTGGRIIHYYREGFIHLNTLVYLRTLPAPGTLAGILLAGLPNTPAQSVLNVFSSSQAVVNGRDELVVDGNVVSTPTFASASKTAISFFLYDDGDGMTELTPVGLFGSFTFLSGVDMFFQTATPAFVEMRLNGRKLRVPNIPSDQGIVIGVFD